VELSNSFEVARPIGETWAALTDVERVAPCLPGAQMHAVGDGEYRGVIRVRLGPITTRFAGAARIVEQNATDYKIVVEGQGLDADGESTADAVLTAKLEPISDTTTRVLVDTDLAISGRVAQLGKGVLPEVTTNLVAQFSGNLAALLDGTHGHARQPVEMPEPDAIDLMDAARTPVLKRIAGVVAVVLGLLAWRWRNR
jgi:hypothetical protein